MSKLLALAGAVCVLIPASAAAQAAFVTDRTAFTAAAGASSTETYNEFSSGVSFNTSPFTYQNVTYSVNGPGVPTARNQIEVVPSSAETNVNGSADLDLRSDASNSVVFSFAAPLNAIGFDLAGYSTGATPSLFSVFNGASLVSSYSAAPSTGFLGFYGGGPFTSVVFSSSGNDVFGLDNLTTSLAAAVPEPATWGMMILGMGAIGFSLRRKQKVETTVRFA